jgi:diguanylate cyclase (GGDEF)-like protein
LAHNLLTNTWIGTAPEKTETAVGVLIVDDDGEMRRACKALLERAGYNEIWTADSVTGALAFLNVGKPESTVPHVDVILMDIVMPDASGIEAARRIKEDERLHDVPILMVTAMSDDRDLEAAFAAGAIDYITKPVKVVELLARLRSALILKRELDNRKARQQELLELTEKLRETNYILEKLSTQDALTGLANRRSFDRVMHVEWARSVREATALSAIMIDIDFFKAYNDYYGHLKGDECLRQVAHTLRSKLRRPGDLVARYGGEEFLALLPHTGRDGAYAVAHAFHDGVDLLHLEHAASPIADHVTLSLGVATVVPSSHSHEEDLIRFADHALYDAKHQGRDRIVVYDGAVVGV